MKKINKIFNNLKEKALNWYNSLDNKQRTITLITLVLIFIVLSILISNIRGLNRDRVIDYKNYDGYSFYVTGKTIDDNTYETLKHISSNIIKEYTQVQEYKMYKKEFNNFYNIVISDEYRNMYSKRKMFDKTKSFSDKARYCETDGDEFIPAGITNYYNNFYIIKYSSVIDETNYDSYIGIYLDSQYKKYYVWYIE